ncbi:lipase 3-like [Condylostylus longicornis]|uniref:lipase 3-like n=1 Tax=Condylostylus longicornis TaxID=2530218 RepID=UPI00244E1ACA|nr:lipase 3-like [Condylostylus longicornis]
MKFLNLATLCAFIAFTSALPIDEYSLMVAPDFVSQENVSLEYMRLFAPRTDPGIIMDAYLTTPQLLKKYGYPAETHKVQTPDGYILEMHRIPRPGAIPVYLQHGIMDSSGGWVIMGPHSAFAYFLYEQGYDVWMGNCRGNRYSRSHTHLSVDKKDFWDYSFHEIGTYDLPAMIDHVIEQTGYKKIQYVGHSQGTTAFWVMCAQRPGYCDKVITMQAMAPIAYMEYVKSPLIRALAPLTTTAEIVAKLLGMHEFLPNNDIMRMAGEFLCKDESFTQILCTNVMFLVTGYNSEQLNTTMLPAILGHVPAGTSTKQFIHYGQLVNSGRFRMYDYGMFKNLAKYGTFKPPSYDLSKVTAPVALHFSMNDWLADTKDVAKLEDQLPNIIKQYLVPQPKFNHLDFILAIDSRKLVHTDVLTSMKDYERKAKLAGISFK